nr:equilibrative nucleotide transporter 1-like [Spinacia oleracea]
MGVAVNSAADDAAVSLLNRHTPGGEAPKSIPKDSFHFAYIIYFTLGAGFLLPWNAFITAVDYFGYLYPDESVDRIFAVAYMLTGLFSLLVIIFSRRKSDAIVRINTGLGLFVVALLVVPLMDLFYIKGQSGLYDGFYVTVGALGLSGLADALVQGGLIGSAGELPARYMQAVVAGTAASGLDLISLKISSFFFYFFGTLLLLYVFGMLLFYPLYLGIWDAYTVLKSFKVRFLVADRLVCYREWLSFQINQALACRNIRDFDYSVLNRWLWLFGCLAVGSTVSWFWVI